MDYAERILKLKDYTGEDEVITSLDMKYELSTLPDNVRFKSLLPSLDEVIDGFEGGELIAVSGPRKAGKTLFAQTLTKNFADQEIYSLWFSFELTPKQFIKRFGIDMPNILMPRKLKAYAMDWLEDRILESIAKYGISVVFIDHLHFLFDMAKIRNTSIEIGQIIRHLKRLAIDLNLLFFIMCHTQKISGSVEELNDEVIRDSSFISQESDCGMLIWRIKNTETKANLKVCYHRRTGCWEKIIKLQKVNDLLREVYE